MKKTVKKVLSFILVLAMVLSLTPTGWKDAYAAPTQKIDGFNVNVYVDDTVASIDEAKTATLSDADIAAGYRYYDVEVDVHVYYPGNLSMQSPMLLFKLLESDGGKAAYEAGLQNDVKKTLFGLASPYTDADCFYNFTQGMPNEEANNIFSFRGEAINNEADGMTNMPAVSIDAYGNKYYSFKVFYNDIKGVGGDSHTLKVSGWYTAGGYQRIEFKDQVDYGVVAVEGNGKIDLPYQITYNANGATSGTVPASAEVVKGGTYEILDGNALKKNNDIFVGWSTDASVVNKTLETLAELNALSDFYEPGDQITVNDNQNFYAVWAKGNGFPDMFIQKVDLQIENGTWFSKPTNTSRDKETVTVDVKITVDGDPNSKGSAKGYGYVVPPSTLEPVADSNYVNTGAWDPVLTTQVSLNADPTASNPVYQLKFPKQSYTITYNAQGASSGTAPTDSNVYDVDNRNATIQGNTGNLARTKTATEQGIFVGWSETPGLYVSDASDLINFYKEGQIVDITALNRSLTLYPAFAVDKLGNPNDPDGNGMDDVPDIYQKEVKFIVEGGTFGTGTRTTRTKYVTLTDTAGEWSDASTATGTIAFPNDMVPMQSWSAPGKWYEVTTTGDVELTTTPTTVQGPANTRAEYKFKYTKGTLSVRYNATQNGGTGTYTDSTLYPEGSSVTVYDGSGFSKTKAVLVGYTVGSYLPNDIKSKSEIPSSYTFIPLGGQVTLVNESVTLYTVWAVDENEDDIPDMYQKKITFSIQNGTWIDPSDNTRKSDDIVVWLNLLDSSSEPAEDGKATLAASSLPTNMQPTGNYDPNSGAWDYPTELAALQVANGVSSSSRSAFVYSFSTQKFGITYDANGASGTAPTDPNTYEAGDNVTLLAPTNLVAPANSVFLGWSAAATVPSTAIPASTPNAIPADVTAAGSTMQMADGGLTVKPVWGEDSNGDDVYDGYQKEITLVISNGTWKNPTTGAVSSDSISVWVDLYKNGVPAADGTGQLSAASLPTEMTAKSGYNQASGKWDDAAGLEALKAANAVSSTSKSTFTYSFDQSQIIINPDPNGKAADILKVYRFSPYTSAESHEPGGYTDTCSYPIYFDTVNATYNQISELIANAKAQVMQVSADRKTVTFVDADLKTYLGLGVSQNPTTNLNELTVKSKKPGAVKVTMTYGELSVSVLVVTPGDVDNNGAMTATDWMEIRLVMNESEGYQDKLYTVEFNGTVYNIWHILADMDSLVVDSNVIKQAKPSDWIRMRALLNEYYY